MRRDFNLPENDRGYLDNLGLNYETIKSDGYRFGYSNLFVIIYGYFINQDYYRLDGGGETVDVLLQIPPGYPNTQIDMASFYPHLKRADNAAIPNIHSFYDINGKNWQTWSRHRTGESVWNPAIDYIGTHMAYVEAFLRREVGANMNKIESIVKINMTLKEKDEMYILRTSKKEENPTYKELDKSAYSGRLKINMGKK
jgi:hypothetical protein